MDDQILNSVTTASGTQYLGPLELFMNTLDWALKDDELLEIRARAHFNRTLPPMERQAQALIEYFNYGLAVLWLILLAMAHWLGKILRQRPLRQGPLPVNRLVTTALLVLLIQCGIIAAVYWPQPGPDRAIKSGTAGAIRCQRHRRDTDRRRV